MEHHLQRAEVLMQQGRFENAITEIKKYLAQYPEDAEAFGALAACYYDLDQYEEAMVNIKKAISYDPQNSGYFILLGMIHVALKDLNAAQKVADEALRINPYNSSVFYLMAVIGLAGKKHKLALEHIDKALGIDPEEVDYLNLRSTILIEQNDKYAANEAVDFALSKDPEKGYALANKGWLLLRQGKYPEAMDHFRSALRNEPELEFAQQGLKEAIRAKFPPYRLFLKFALFMGSLTNRARWAVIIGLYGLFRLAKYIIRENPELTPILAPVIVLYLFFAFSTWIIGPLGNIILLFHPLGKHAVNKDEKMGVLFVGGALVLALITFVASQLIASEELLLLPIFFITMLIPIGGVFTTETESRGRKILIGYAIVLATLGITAIMLPQYLMEFGGAYLLGVFLYGWIANYIIMKEA